jgi:hypothetical protein
MGPVEQAKDEGAIASVLVIRERAVDLVESALKRERKTPPKETS